MGQAHTRPSIWTKSRQRGAAKKYLFGNFTARQLIPNEHYLNRAGLRGRKIWLCLCLFVVVYLVALAHLALTCVMLGVLRFGAGGPPYFLFQSDGSLVWPEGGNLTNVQLVAPAGNISAYSNQPLHVTGEKQNSINLQSPVADTAPAAPSQVSVAHSSVQFSPENSMHMFSSSTGRSLLNLSSNYFQLPELPVLTASLSTTKLRANSVRNVNSIQSPRRLLMRGAAGVNIIGSYVNITAGETAALRAKTELELEGGHGVILNPNRLPRVEDMAAPTYHLCSCTDRKLFLVHTNPQGCFAAVGNIESICS